MDWKLALLNAYRLGTLPFRAVRNARLAQAGKLPVFGVFYHHITDRATTPWATSNAVFRRQINWLARHFEFVSLEEAQRRIRQGNFAPCVHISFDDGYAENCDYALPYLIERKIPCTYFVTTHFVANGIPFPHDLARGQRHQPNTFAELRDLAAAGIEIGCHTHSHANLGAVKEERRLHDEIVFAGEELQAEIQCPVRYFAFPYGKPANMQPLAFQMAYEAGYEAVCSAYGGYNRVGGDAFHIQRVHGDDELVRLKNWASFDPRKLKMPEYDYKDPTAVPGEQAHAFT